MDTSLKARVVMMLRVTLLLQYKESGSDSLAGFPARSLDFQQEDHDILPAGFASLILSIPKMVWRRWSQIVGQRVVAARPAGAGLLPHQLFWRCNLFDRRSSDFGLLALFIGSFRSRSMTPARCSCLIRASCAFFFSAKNW
jgi:hypothetical protein